MAKAFSYKKFEIEKRNAKNEPFLTLEHLHTLIGSIHKSFSGSSWIHNPSPSVLKFISNSQALSAYDLKFDIAGLKDEDYQNTNRGEQYIHATLYPDDIIEVVFRTRLWIEDHYKKELGDESWSLNATGLQRYWQDAVKQRKTESSLTNPIATFSKHYLEDAIEELYQVIEVILGEKTEAVEYATVDEFIKEIKADFIKEPEQVWQKIGLKVTRGLAAAELNSFTISIKDDLYKPEDVRLILNTVFEEIVNYLKQDKEKIEEPWDRVLQESDSAEKLREIFNENKLPYFVTNDLKKPQINVSDKTRAELFIEWIDLLLKELKKDLPKTSTETVADETDEDGGGEDTPDEAKKSVLLTADEIRKKILDELEDSLLSGEEFISHFIKNLKSLNDDQQTWLLANLRLQILELLAQGDTKTWLNLQVNEFISKLSLENPESDRYQIGESQLEKFHEKLLNKFFVENNTYFLELIGQAESKSEEELKDQSPVEAPQQKKDATVPKTEADTPFAGTQPDSGLNIERAMAIRDLTTQFLGMNFGEGEGEFLRSVVYEQISGQLPANFTKTDLSRLRSDIFRKLQLNEKVFKAAADHYEKRLKQIIDLQNAKDLPNIYNTIDSLLVLIEDPQEYLSKLNDQELKEQFGLENTNVSATELRSLLLGLLFIRRAHFYFSGGFEIKPLLSQQQTNDKELAKSQIIQIRDYIHKTDQYGDGTGVTALNTSQIDQKKMSFNDKQKEIIRQLYEGAWRETITGKSYDELVELYSFYDIYDIQIDYSQPLPVPENFIYSQLAYGLNHPQINPAAAAAGHRFFGDGASDEKGRLGDKFKQKAGQAALGLVAPELAPILKAMEAIPGLNKVAEKIEKEAGQVLVSFAQMLGGGALALLGWMGQSLSALYAGIGGLLGGAIGLGFGMPVLGAAVGGGLGWGYGSIKAGLGGGSGGGLGGLFKGLGGGGGGASATTQGALGSAASAGGGGFKLAKMINVQQVAVVGGTVGVTAVSVFSINGKAASQINPLPSFNTTVPGTGEASPYVEITKDAEPKYLDEPGLITYTINITPKDNYNIIITDILDEVKVRYNKDKYPGGVPTPSDTTHTIDDFDDLDSGTVINFGDTLQVIYEVDYSSEFQHANVVNYFTLSFDYSGPDSGSAEAMSLASVKFGEAPIFEGGWPVCSGIITQMPFDLYSHDSEISPGYGADAIDVGAVAIGTTVYATFDGRVIVSGTRGNYGTAIVIETDVGFFIFAHLSTSFVSVGDEVTAGDEIALSGDTGAGLAHLHYEWSPTSRFYTIPLGSESNLLQLHESVDLKKGDHINREGDERCGTK